MTEAEWIHCADPRAVLEWLRNCRKLSERKSRLFAVACARKVWPWMLDERSRQAIEVSEQFADGLVGQKVLNTVRREAFAASKSATSPSSEQVAAIVALDVCMNTKRHDCWEMAEATAECANSLIFHVLGDAAGWADREAQCEILRCIFGNPFRLVAINPFWFAWNDRTIPKIAQAIYEDCAFDRLPILADALEDAGCNNADILAHCRGPGPHVRGCWVVDLLLGKE
jgi:hypothetical protein